MAHVDWPFYELCDNIYGNSGSSARPSSSVAESAAASPPTPALSSPPLEDDDHSGVRRETEETTKTTLATTDDVDIDGTHVIVEQPEEERPKSFRQHTRGELFKLCASFGANT